MCYTQRAAARRVNCGASRPLHPRALPVRVDGRWHTMAPTTLRLVVAAAVVVLAVAPSPTGAGAGASSGSASSSRSGSGAASSGGAANGTAAAGSEALGPCKNCVYVLERIKQGYHYLLPNICEEILAKTKLDDEYATCHKMLAGLSKWGLDVRHWLHNGCYKVEPYNAMSLVQPCPSHVICSKITDLDAKPFCSEVLTDFKA